MLTIGTLGGHGLTAGRTPDYYEDSVASGREDYYSGRGEAPGRWLGTGATDLGLDGEVLEGELGRLAAGRDPVSGRELRTPIGDGAVWGFDLNFDAPKSVSVLFATSEAHVAEAVRDSHDQAVAAAFTLLEERACVTRRGKRGVRVAGEGLTAAAYRHRTSRAGDPHLHTHVVVGNVTRVADGRHRTLDSRSLFAWAKTAGYLYQAELRAHLTDRLGVDWGEVRNGYAELVGMSAEVRRHFSRRRIEIEAEMRRVDGRSGRSAQIAAYRTRQAKDYSVPAHRLQEEWRARAAEHGFTEVERDALLGLVTRHDPTPAEERAFAADLADITGLTREASSFDERDVLREWASVHRHGASVARVRDLTEEFLRSPDVVPLDQDGRQHRVGAARVCARTDSDDDRRGGRRVPAHARPRYSTQEMLAAERSLIRSALERRGEGAGTATPEAVEQALSGRLSLGTDQRAMVRELCTSGDGVKVVRAAAGSGKTFALDAAREAWEASGRRVFGCAVAARAKEELADQAGIDSSTIASLVGDLDRGFTLTEGSVLVVEEAGMTGTRPLARLAQACDDAGAKLVLVGDDHQLPEIDAGGAFRGLAARLPVIELTENRRQRDELERQALHDLRTGNVERWAAALADRGRLVVSSDAEETRRALVAAWWDGERQSAPGQAVMIALRRADVADLNQRARAYMRASGRLGRHEIDAAGVAFATGDEVVATTNDRAIGAFNGWTGTVREVAPTGRSLTVAFHGRDRDVEIPSRYLEVGGLAHGYATTAHKAQGATRDRVYVLGSDEMYAEWGYTAASRHREELRFFYTVPSLREGPDEQRDDGLADLRRVLGRSRAKELALDIWEGDQDVTTTPVGQLATEAQELRELLETHPLSGVDVERRGGDLEHARAQADAAAQHLAETEQERDALGARQRRARRAEFAIRLEGDRQAAQLAAQLVDELQVRQHAEDARGARWTDEHGADLSRLAAIEQELASRRADERERTREHLTRSTLEEVQRHIGPRPEGDPAREGRADPAVAAADDAAHPELAIESDRASAGHAQPDPERLVHAAAELAGSRPEPEPEELPGWQLEELDDCGPDLGL